MLVLMLVRMVAQEWVPLIRVRFLVRLHLLLLPTFLLQMLLLHLYCCLLGVMWLQFPLPVCVLWLGLHLLKRTVLLLLLLLLVV